jgi:hypothetical protein
MITGMGFPDVGDWFRRVDGSTFEVIAVDEADNTIELQHFDGTLEEIDLDAWLELAAEPVDPPEDWSGSMDVDEADLPPGEEPHRAFSDPLDFVDDYEGS